MPGIDTKVVNHHLAIHPSAKLVAQRKRKVGEETRADIHEEVGKLSYAGFIIESKHPTWLANMVIV